MALGDITDLISGSAADRSAELVAVELLASATATNSPPASATAGLDVNTLTEAFGGIPTDLTLLVISTAGSATMTVTGRLWFMFGTLGSIATGAWVPAGPGGDATKGVINEGGAIGETGSDTIRHCELISYPAHAKRIYFEITAIGGTSTAVTVFLVGRKRYGSY